MMDFEEYIRQGEPGKREKGHAWQTAIGLQEVDGLKTSDYLKETARKHIEGDITIEEVKQLMDSYYTSKVGRNGTEDRTEEADKVSARITEILSEQSFTFSPMEYITIYRRLFQRIYEHAGKIRDYNITKREWVLDGETVVCAGADNIRETLEYDFSREKFYDYRQHNADEAIAQIAQFVADIWQIHPFGEGNTRATAVFAINNDAFAHHSWFFRNALVRANYNNILKGIHSTNEYIVKFFSNLILGEKHVLMNRHLHIREGAQSANDEVSNTLDCTLEEVALINFIQEHPKATQNEMAIHIGRSPRTIKTLTVKLSEQGILERKGGRRDGYWHIHKASN